MVYNKYMKIYGNLRNAMKKILFVCTGNTCRSPMAEGIFNHAVSRREDLAGRFASFSAGLSADEGEPASENSIKVLRDEWGIDISEHRSRRLDGCDVEAACLVLAMTRGHKDALMSAFPIARQKTFTLKEYALFAGQRSCCPQEYDYAFDIPDPYGGSLQVYKICAWEIKEAVGRLLEKLAEKPD